jgi:hypothetical protein
MVARPNLTLLAIAAVLIASAGVTNSASPTPGPDSHRRVHVLVDSVVASDTHEGVDSRLSTMGPRLHSLFSYSTYRLVSHQEDQTDLGRLVSFELPGGRILHVEPNELEGDMIGMELVLFQGEKPMMTTDLRLPDHGHLILGGRKYEQGMLIILIGADTLGSGKHSAPAATAQE